MRIMLFAPEAMDMHTERLVQWLLRANHSVFLLARHNPISVQDEKFSYIQYRPFNLPGWVHPYKLRQFLLEWVNKIYLRLVWEKLQTDIVHTIFIGQGAFYCALARLSPLVLTALGSDINDPFEKGYPSWQTKVAKTLLAARHITADANEVLSRCEVLAGKPLKSSLFYFGIDLQLFYSRPATETLTLRKKLQIPLDSKVVLSPRRLTYKMNHEVVLKAFAQFLQSNDNNYYLIFRRFGSFSVVIQNDLQELARKLKVNDQVIWLDTMPYEELPILYSLADLIINIPEQDGLPVTLFEASACKVPLITSDLPSYQEFLAKGAYFRVAVRDIDGIVSAMQKVLRDRDDELVEGLQRNYDLIVQVADQSKCFATLEKIYQSLQSK